MITGVDLNWIDPKTIDYIYRAPDGSFQFIECKNLVINDSVLIVDNA